MPIASRRLRPQFGSAVANCTAPTAPQLGRPPIALRRLPRAPGRLLLCIRPTAPRRLPVARSSAARKSTTASPPTRQDKQNKTKLTDLRTVDLRTADLIKADLKTADLIKADLKTADLRIVKLEKTKQHNIDLQKAELIRSEADCPGRDQSASPKFIRHKWRQVYPS